MMIASFVRAMGASDGGGTTLPGEARRAYRPGTRTIWTTCFEPVAFARLEATSWRYRLSGRPLLAHQFKGPDRRLARGHRGRWIVVPVPVVECSQGDENVVNLEHRAVR
jgi:hypothetical protein